jgi:hypothetical protein
MAAQRGRGRPFHPSYQPHQPTKLETNMKTTTTKRLEQAIATRLENRAFRQGFNAAIQRVDAHSNPYDERITPTLAWEWDRGYRYVVDELAESQANLKSLTNFLQTT